MPSYNCSQISPLCNHRHWKYLMKIPSKDHSNDFHRNQIQVKIMTRVLDIMDNTILTAMISWLSTHTATACHSYGDYSTHTILSPAVGLVTNTTVGQNLMLENRRTYSTYWVSSDYCGKLLPWKYEWSVYCILQDIKCNSLVRQSNALCVSRRDRVKNTVFDETLGLTKVPLTCCIPTKPRLTHQFPLIAFYILTIATIS